MSANSITDDLDDSSAALIAQKQMWLNRMVAVDAILVDIPSYVGAPELDRIMIMAAGRG